MQFLQNHVRLKPTDFYSRLFKSVRLRYLDTVRFEALVPRLVPHTQFLLAIGTVSGADTDMQFITNEFKNQSCDWTNRYITDRSYLFWTRFNVLNTCSASKTFRTVASKSKVTYFYKKRRKNF